KWIAGRYRPFKLPELVGDSDALAPFTLHPFPPSGTNLSFPSGHACLAFATACAMGMLWPRLRWVFYAVATLVAAERVAENAHWPSDAVAAAAVGVGVVHLTRAAWRRFAPSPSSTLGIPCTHGRWKGRGEGGLSPSPSGRGQG